LQKKDFSAVFHRFCGKYLKEIGFYNTPRFKKKKISNFPQNFNGAENALTPAAHICNIPSPSVSS
jgi:hypothetical protein